MRLWVKGARSADQASENAGNRGWPLAPEGGAANTDELSLRELDCADAINVRMWPHPLWRVGMDLVQPATGPGLVEERTA